MGLPAYSENNFASFSSLPDRMLSRKVPVDYIPPETKEDGIISGTRGSITPYEDEKKRLETLKTQRKLFLFSYFDRYAYCKVPFPTWVFWINKTCCTTVGETVSDFFNTNLGLGLSGAAAMFFPLLFLFLLVQFQLDRYIPFIYWINVIFMSICGTIFTDGIHDNLGMELWKEIIIFFFCMVVIFGLWYLIEKTIDIHSITTFRRECFYWLAVLFTFAFGTAVGDAISESANVGYGPTLGIFGGIMVVVGGLWFFKVTGPVTSFWFAYVMTRPLGAALGDVLSHRQGKTYTAYYLSPTMAPVVTMTPTTNITYPSSFPTGMPTPAASVITGGGAGLGTGYTSLLFILIIILLTGLLTYTRMDVSEVLEFDVLMDVKRNNNINEGTGGGGINEIGIVTSP